MNSSKKPAHDVLIYPTNVLEFEITVDCVEGADSVEARLLKQCQSIQSDGYRVLALTDQSVASIKHILCLRTSAAEFDQTLVNFVNSTGRCALVIDGCTGVSSPGVTADLLGRINKLCLEGGGIDWISVLLPKDWKDEFLAASPVAQAHAESLADDLKYRAEQAANAQASHAVTEPEPTAVHDSSITTGDQPVTARVHMAAEVLKGLMVIDPHGINEAMFDRAVDITDQMLLALAVSRNAHGVES